MLKDLVWKYPEKQEEIKKIKSKLGYLYSNQELNKDDFYFENAEFIAELKAKAQNIPTEYTKEDVICMFIAAGFDYDGTAHLNIPNCPHAFIRINYDKISFYVNDFGIMLETDWIGYSDRASIESYYGFFKQIYELGMSKNDTQSN